MTKRDIYPFSPQSDAAQVSAQSKLDMGENVPKSDVDTLKRTISKPDADATLKSLGASGIYDSMSAHADKVHPVK